MPRLVDGNSGSEYALDDALGIDGYAVLGRHPIPFMKESTISRFHATIFQVGDQHYLVDHSMNGTLYAREGVNQEDSQVVSSITNHEVSHAEARASVAQGKPGHITLNRDSYDDYMGTLSAFLRELADPEQREHYASFGVRLTRGMQIFFIGTKTSCVFRD